MTDESDCDEYCTLFRWNHCKTLRKDDKCDNPEMYNCEELEYRRYYGKRKDST